MEHFYQQSRLTAVEQITFHDTKIKHFTFHANKYLPFTAHENTLSHPLDRVARNTSFIQFPKAMLGWVVDQYRTGFFPF
jgi:hypothetical protein